MPSIIDHLIKEFKEATKQAYPDMGHQSIEIKQSTQESFGNYQYNSAMKLAKELKLSPHKVAEAIVNKLTPPPPESLIAKLEVAGPGFINITLNSIKIASIVKNMLNDPLLGVETPSHKQKIIVEFSSPNTAKELHVGHLRSTIIGDAIARTFEFLGHDVLRLNHIGDWGTQFGMLIAYMKETVPEVLKGATSTDLTHIVTWYKDSKARFDKDPAFKKLAQLEVVELQSGNPESLKAWGILCEISRKSYQEIYDLLDVKLVERGESYYNPVLAKTVADLEEKGLVTESGGAKCIFMEGFINREGDPLPLMVQKSDGGYNYDTTDMAAIKQRIFEEKAERIIIVTDAGQALHFNMIFKAAELAGWNNPEKLRLDHVPFGMVLGSDGKKFKTRSGDTEKLIDLLLEAVVRAKKILEERNPEWNEKTLNAAAKNLGIGALKYADLSTNRIGDYHFSYDKMLKLEGNTAAYLMYSFVRIRGIKNKVGIDINQIKDSTSITLTHPTEIALAVHLAQFGEAIQKVTEELLPNRLSDYLYNLADKFHAFFRDCRVEGTAEQNSRLLLVEAVAQVMKKGLEILGVKTLEKM